MRLKNCPFCGGDAVGYEGRDYSEDGMTYSEWKIYCTSCEASVSANEFDAKKEDCRELAKSLWNNRV